MRSNEIRMRRSGLPGCHACLARSGLAAPRGVRQHPGDRESLFLHRQIARAPPPARWSPSAHGEFGRRQHRHHAGHRRRGRPPKPVQSRWLDFDLHPVAPAAAQYRYAVTQQGYDAAAAAAGTPLAALDDDDARRHPAVRLPLLRRYLQQVYVNSDGNLTFTAGDSASTERSLGRMTAGPAAHRAAVRRSRSRADRRRRARAAERPAWS